MHYYVLLISLFESFVATNAPQGEVNVNNIVSQSKGCHETLIRMYYLRHSFESYDPTLTYCLTLLAFSTLNDMHRVERTSSEHELMRSMLILCAKGLWDQGRCCYISVPIAHLLLEAADPEDARLIRKFTEIGVSDTSSYVEHMEREIRSKWPIGVFTFPREGEYHTLDRFLQWRKANGNPGTSLG